MKKELLPESEIEHLDVYHSQALKLITLSRSYAIFLSIIGGLNLQYYLLFPFPATKLCHEGKLPPRGIALMAFSFLRKTWTGEEFQDEAG
ncbi:MAG: hypothetical protein AB1424_09755 [Thermodesulfobacteriota bacterium]